MRRRFFLGFLSLAAVALLSCSAMAQQKFTAHLDPSQEVPSTASTGSGSCVVTLNAAETSINVTCTYQGLTSALQADHIHGNAAPGANAAVLINFGATGGTSGTFTLGPLAITPTQVASMRAHLFYINLHTTNFPGGEIRGQLKQASFSGVSDFDGDGRSDITVFRQSANTFYILRSLTNTLEADLFGSGTGDNFLNNTADFDGDGRADALIIKLDATGHAVWSILQSATNTVRTVVWGDFNAAASDSLAPGDYDGDGIEDIATFRRTTGVWNIIQSSNGQQRFEQWGAATGVAATSDFPCVGDYDGDGITDLTAVRVEGSNRVFYIRQSATNTLRAVIWGASTDGVFFFAKIDVDGDGKQDVAVNRTVSGQRVHFIQRSSDGQPYTLAWGASGTGSTALFGDYDGDGKTDFVARVSSGGVLTWNIFQSASQTQRTVVFGATGDQ
ncbi:MAG: CHRD domain-containing protein [Acidobacteria bacterium]|nr:CHRD domain-containing protein [Acidobacteriota bacterium]